MKTMGYDVIGELLITVHTTAPPIEAEWKPYVAALAELVQNTKDHSKIRNIVFTDGGAPDSLQRKVVNDIAASRPPVPTAVVSGSTMVRSVVTALAWFNPKIKAFSPRQIDEAYRYLGFSPSQVEVFRPRLEKLQAQIGTKVTAIAESLEAARTANASRR